jgi:tRNA threonylcarbamoyladenosine modification (KEOPS) complex  Pcc1 subunit
MSSAKANITLTLILNKTEKLNYSRILGKRGVKHDRSRTTLKETSNNLTITIKATDATALRASANSVLRDLQIIESTKFPDAKARSGKRGNRLE